MSVLCCRGIILTEVCSHGGIVLGSVPNSVLGGRGAGFGMRMGLSCRRYIWFLRF